MAVFISFRISENDDHAAFQLKDALEAAGVSVYLCDPQVGDDLAATIANAVAACELFVVLGTAGYGTQGYSRFSTREELELALERRKPIYLIKRCDEFADPLTQMYLPASMMYQQWAPYMPLAVELVEDIKAKLESRAPQQAGHATDPLQLDAQQM
jgi:hypothetical protein